jgi:pyruvate dehydrogenase E1 component alpha subunit
MSKKAAKVYDRELLVSMYREMLLYRRFEEAANRAYTKGKFAGFCHLHIGQEAVCVGVQKALRDTDYMISGYRSHTQAMAKGIDPNAVMAELFGKRTGCAMGKGGSMHMFSNEKRFLGGHGIVGGQVPLATGVGFKIRYRNEDDICVCYLGDGAVNQGQFYEALNMAATWSLPVLYIIENNRYGMGTDFRRVTSVDHLWKRALAFDMDHSDVDGMNVLSVYDHVNTIVDGMRKSKRPYLLEAMTYRYRGHSVSDPGTYRTKEEVQSFQDNDAIKTLGDFMLKAGHVKQEQLDAWDAETKAQVKEIEATADAAPQPEDALAYEHVFYRAGV